MAVKTSNKATETTVKDFKYYTGVIPYTVVAVNPSLKELKDLGIEYMKNEPQYVTEQKFDDNIVKSTIVDFWLKSVPDPDNPDMEILNNIRFRINHDVWVGNNTGKTQYINKYGRTAWANDPSDLDANEYFKNEGSRPSHRGEEELHKFLFSWLNMSYDEKKGEMDECLIDADKLIKGDFSELKGIIPTAKEYVVKILTGVDVVEKDGKIKYYQSFYNKMFLKHNQTSTNRLEEFVSKDYNEFKADFYTFDLRQFDKSAKPDEDPDDSKEVF